MLPSRKPAGVAEILEAERTRIRTQAAALKARAEQAWSEHRELSALPPSRDELAALLTRLFNTLTERGLTKLCNAGEMANFQRGDREAAARFPDRVVNAIGFPNGFDQAIPWEFLFHGVSVDAITDAVIERLNWNPPPITGEQRQAKLVELSLAANAAQAELSALREETARLGIAWPAD